MLSAALQEQFNRDVQNWTKQTKTALAMKLAALPLESQVELLQRARGDRKPLDKSVKSYIKKEFGQAEIIRFSFWLHGFFYDRGVGRGQKVGQAGKRIPKPWIDFVLEDAVENLADMIMEAYGDEVVETIKFRK